MDEIIAVVLKRLQARMKSQATVDLADENSLVETSLLHHHYIKVTGVTQAHLEALQQRQAGPWLTWMDQAIAYGCDISLVTTMVVNQQWNPEMILQWPVRFIDKQGRQVYSFKERIISASAIRTCKNESVILKFRGQRFTALGLDELRSRQLECVEGTKRYADW
ncbi:PduM family microcompartment protein [Veillonella criceti]|uniref:Putative propanediol utilization protein PduM n=1 Tax=Veillonella criceti TaxID=103891 RepID=A0A380NLW2_9FIRM|nr:PduM family microcompartment protein [Veillonella criceti]SUP44299.1 putative propanediol utilization protein PduM [Veillonella criceti]